MWSMIVMIAFHLWISDAMVIKFQHVSMLILNHYVCSHILYFIDIYIFVLEPNNSYWCMDLFCRYSMNSMPGNLMRLMFSEDSIETIYLCLLLPLLWCFRWFSSLNCEICILQPTLLSIYHTSSFSQVIIIMFLGKFTSTVRLSWKFWLVSIAIGFIRFVVWSSFMPLYLGHHLMH